MDLSAALARARSAADHLTPLRAATKRALAVAKSLGSPPVAAGGAPDPSAESAGNLSTVGAGQIPPGAGVPRRRRRIGGEQTQKAEAFITGDPTTDGSAAPVPPVEVDGLEDPILIVFQGLTVCIDRPAGFTQVKLAPDGSVAWTRTYTTNYGYLPGTAGGDEEELDCFVGPDSSSEEVWWFYIQDAAGAFDEYKLVFGCIGEAAARAIILAHIPEQFVAPGAAYTTVSQIMSLLGKDPAARTVALEVVSKALDRTERMSKALKAVTAFTSKAPLQEMIEAPASLDHPAVTMPLSGTYPDPAAVGGWLGWIEPNETEQLPRPPAVDVGAGRYSENGFGDWIAFVGVDGRALLWTDRDADGGVVGAPMVFMRPDLAQKQEAEPAEKAAPTEVTIQLKTSPDGLAAIKGVIGAMKRTGDVGHGAVLAYEDGGYFYQCGYFDGDGADKLSDITINGEALEVKPEDYIWNNKDLVPVGKEFSYAERERIRERMTGAEKSAQFKIVTKAAPDQEERYLLGIVLEPETTDAQGEIYAAEVIRDSAFNWLADFRNIDAQHVVFINRKVRIVESYIAPLDFWIDAQGNAYAQEPTGGPYRAGEVQFVRKGSWLLAVIVEDHELWASIRRGEITGWSISGLSRGEPVS